MFRKSLLAFAAIAALSVTPALAGQSVTDPLYVNLVPAPAGAVQASASGAAASQTATIPAVVGRTAYICGASFTATGATAGLAVAPTITGLAGGTMTFAFDFPAGVLVGAVPLVLDFSNQGGCLPASAANVAIAGVLPSGGSGNTNEAVAVWGYYR